MVSKDERRALVNKMIYVDADTLGNLTVKHNAKRLDFLKIDVEGGRV